MRADRTHNSGLTGAAALAALCICLSGLLDSVSAQSRPERPYVKDEKIFGDVVDYDRKLVETEGVSLNNLQPGTMLCLVAAVRLSTSVSAQPPRRDRSRPSFLQFGGNWKPTPPSTKAPKGKDLLDICQAFIAADGLDEKMRNALSAPGAFYIADWTGSSFQLYAPGERLAVSIRYLRRNPD